MLYFNSPFNKYFLITIRLSFLEVRYQYYAFSFASLLNEKVSKDYGNLRVKL